MARKGSRESSSTRSSGGDGKKRSMRSKSKTESSAGTVVNTAIGPEEKETTVPSASPSSALPTRVEIAAPLAGKTLCSPLAIVSARYENATARAAVLTVGGVRHIVELNGTSGQLRENVTLLEGANRIEIAIGGATHAVEVTVAPSQGISFLGKDIQVAAKCATRALELNGEYDGASCPAGVISVNGFMQQFAVPGAKGVFAEKVVLRPGLNHLAVQVGELYATRRVEATVTPAKMLVTLVWDTNGTDIDLHVHEPGGAHVYYGNKDPPGAGTLDVDRVQGYGPENYSTGCARETVKEGEYRVQLHYFSARAVGRSEWTVRVITDESTEQQQLRTYYGILDATGNWNNVCVARFAADGTATLA